MRLPIALSLGGIAALSLFLAGFYSPFADDESTVSEVMSLVWVGAACVTIALSIAGAWLGGRPSELTLGLAAFLNLATLIVILISPPGKASVLRSDDTPASSGLRAQSVLFVEDLFQNPATACDRMTRRFLVDNYGNSEGAARELCRSDVAESMPAPTLENASVLTAAKDEAVVRVENSDGNGAILHVVRPNQTWMLDKIRDN